MRCNVILLYSSYNYLVGFYPRTFLRRKEAGGLRPVSSTVEMGFLLLPEIVDCYIKLNLLQLSLAHCCVIQVLLISTMAAEYYLFTCFSMKSVPSLMNICVRLERPWCIVMLV